MQVERPAPDRVADPSPALWRGFVRALVTGGTTGGPVRLVPEVNLIAGVGIEGDRYAQGGGSFARRAAAGKALTLIEEETIEAVRRDYGLDIDFTTSRRNVVTSGVPLNHLVGKQFRIGGVLLTGVELNKPCNHLVKLTGIAGLKKALTHRGGLRADVLTAGTIRVGDRIEPVWSGGVS